MLFSGLTCGKALVKLVSKTLVSCKAVYNNQDSHHKHTHTHTSSNLGLMVGILQSASLIQVFGIQWIFGTQTSRKVKNITSQIQIYYYITILRL